MGLVYQKCEKESVVCGGVHGRYGIPAWSAGRVQRQKGHTASLFARTSNVPFRFLTILTLNTILVTFFVSASLISSPTMILEAREVAASVQH